MAYNNFVGSTVNRAWFEPFASLGAKILQTPVVITPQHCCTLKLSCMGIAEFIIETTPVDVCMLQLNHRLYLAQFMIMILIDAGTPQALPVFR